MNPNVVVQQIWRYPVKSMIGARISSAHLGKAGIPGDRAYAIRDESRGAIQGARLHGDLMKAEATLSTPPTNDAEPGPATIVFPDGTTTSTDAPDVNERLSAFLGAPVTIWPLLPASEKAHYRREKLSPKKSIAELKRAMGVIEGESMPNFIRLPPTLVRNETIPGTYFDAAPIMLMSTSSMATLQSMLPDSEIDVRRFRPTLLVDVDSTEPTPEQDWIGKKFRLGEATIKVFATCPRCVMPTRAFADLPQDKSILRTIAKELGRNMGVYANVSVLGQIKEGDQLIPL